MRPHPDYCGKTFASDPRHYCTFDRGHPGHCNVLGFNPPAAGSKDTSRMPNFRALRDRPARALMRYFATIGATLVAQARSPHGSDCDCSPEHLAGPMSQCRCVRVMRVRVPLAGDWALAGDWLLTYGDFCESQAFKLQGPYRHEASLEYGGGFWERRVV